MFFKIVNNEFLKVGDIKVGDVVPLLDITNKKVFLVKYLGGSEYLKTNEYNINSAIGKIFWNMQNLNY